MDIVRWILSVTIRLEYPPIIIGGPARYAISSILDDSAEMTSYPSSREGKYTALALTFRLFET